MNMKKLVTVAFLITLVSASYGQDIEATKRLSNQNYFGITPDEKYGLPNNIGIYSSDTGKISTCIAVYEADESTSISGQNYFGISFKLESTNPVIFTVDESRVFNESKQKTSAGEEPTCYGTYDSSTRTYQDIVQVDSTPYALAFELVDANSLQFQLTDSSVLTESADVAFVLRGYGGTSRYKFTEMFRDTARETLARLSQLSFGKINSYRIFDGGIDQRNPDSFQANENIKVINAALGGWQGSPWSLYLKTHANLGTILIDPTPEQIEILKSARQWILDNGKGLRYGWYETDLGKQNKSWVDSKVVGFGSTASWDFLDGYKLPKGLYPENYKTIGIIFNDETTYQTSGAQFGCATAGRVRSETGSEVRIGLLDSEGRTIGGGKQCWYADDSFSEPNPTGENRESYKSSHSNTHVHEIIHALGQSGHDRASDGKIFQYGIMGSNGGPFFDQKMRDQYPIWNRVYLMGWLPESTITYDRALVKDTKGATDPNGKYLLQLGPENDYDCKDRQGKDAKCHRYQELYDGWWVQYKAPFVKDGLVAMHIDAPFAAAGVRFEPLNDQTDLIPPKVVSTNGAPAEVVRVADEHRIKIKFSEPISLGKGNVILSDGNGQQLASYPTNLIPHPDRYSAVELSTSGNELTIIAYKPLNTSNWLQMNTFDAFRIFRISEYVAGSEGTRLKSGATYSVSFTKGAITDLGGNSVDQNTYSFTAN